MGVMAEVCTAAAAAQWHPPFSALLHLRLTHPGYCWPFMLQLGRDLSAWCLWQDAGKVGRQNIYLIRMVTSNLMYGGGNTDV
jgi:hypothetical protein